MNQSELEANTVHVKGAKRGKTHGSKVLLVLLLIGWQSVASFADQSQSVTTQTKQTQNYFQHSIENRSIGELISVNKRNSKTVLKRYKETSYGSTNKPVIVKDGTDFCWF